jgi:hypothetical protein
MTPRPMTEPEAWREIARRIVEGEWAFCGLCREVWFLYMERGIMRSIRMLERVKHHLDAAGLIGLAYPEGTEPEARALAALWLALEAEEESI